MFSLSGGIFTSQEHSKESSRWREISEAYLVPVILSAVPTTFSSILGFDISAHGNISAGPPDFNRDEVRARSVSDIAFWMMDDDYDGSNFIVRQVFFCGGDKDEFNKWKRGLSDLAKQQTKKNAERTLRVELDDEAFDLLYGFRSHPIAATAGRRIAVRVVSQFGEESMKILNV